jgi:hypothetical protein
MEPMNAGSRGFSPASMRASDADRDRAVTELGEHYQAGRLSTEELDERTGQALRARTLGDLAGLMSDLPAPLAARAAGPPAPPPAMGAVTSRRAVPVVAVVAAVAALAVVLSTVLGHAGPSNGHWGDLGIVLPVLIVARILARRGSGRWR